MSHLLTLDIPDEIYKPLLKKARAQGRSVEETAADFLTASVLTEADDPLLRALGSLEADVNDLGANHDRYITEAGSSRRVRNEHG